MNTWQKRNELFSVETLEETEDARKAIILPSGSKVFQFKCPSFLKLLGMRQDAVMISAILLAAGESKRMGQPKQLMSFGQRTIVEQAIDNLLNSAVSETLVVLGHRAEEVIKTIAAKPVKIVINPDYKQGMSTSIIAGLKVVDSRARAVMFALADQPFVDSQTINSLMEAFVAHGKGIAIPVYQGRRGHPVIFAIKYKGELLGLKGDVGGREIIARYPDDVLEVAVNCEGIYIDIDTVDNYTWGKLNRQQKYTGGRLHDGRH